MNDFGDQENMINANGLFADAFVLFIGRHIRRLQEIAL